MSKAVASVVTLAAATAVVPAVVPAVVGVVVEIVSLGKKIVALYDDVKDTSPMLTELVDQVQSEESEILKMLDGGQFRSVDTLAEYKDHLKEIQEFLDAYKSKNIVQRLAGHARTKETIRKFYTTRENIRIRMDLQFKQASANRLERMDSRAASRFQRMDSQLKRLDMNAQRQGDEMMQEMIVQFQTVHEKLDNQMSSLTDIKHELTYNRELNESEKTRLHKLLQWVDANTSTGTGSASISGWHISESDVRVDKPAIATSEATSLYYGKVSSGASVAVTKVWLSGEDEVNDFKKHADRWSRLRDPHVLPFYGANVDAKPAFLVMARAAKGNFNEFLPDNRHFFWKVFLDVTRGLAYLHRLKKPIVHANLKCSKLLVMADGTGVVSDFQYAFARENSALSKKMQSESSIKWRAPECFRDGKPRVESDVYSLGMCLYEAFTGEPPFAELTEDELVDKMLDDGEFELPTRPNTISDDDWKLITGMCEPIFQDRITIGELFQHLKVRVELERIERERLVCPCDDGVCSSCGKRAPSRNESCP